MSKMRVVSTGDVKSAARLARIVGQVATDHGVDPRVAGHIAYQVAIRAQEEGFVITRQLSSRRDSTS